MSAANDLSFHSSLSRQLGVAATFTSTTGENYHAPCALIAEAIRQRQTIQPTTDAIQQECADLQKVSELLSAYPAFSGGAEPWNILYAKFSDAKSALSKEDYDRVLAEAVKKHNLIDPKDNPGDEPDEEQNEERE